MLVRGTGTSQGIKCDKDVSSCHHLLQHLVRTNLFAPPTLSCCSQPWSGLGYVTLAPGSHVALGTSHVASGMSPQPLGCRQGLMAQLALVP